MHVSDHSINVEALLSNVPLFHSLESAALARVAQGTHALTVRRGHILFREGEIPTGFYLIVYGKMKLSVVSPQGAEKVVEIAVQGQTFGEAEMFLERSHLVKATVLEQSLLLHISAAAIFNELDHDPQFVRKIIAALSLRLHHVIGDVEAYSLYSGCQRLIDYLLRDQPTDRDERISVTLPVSKGVIASRLNMKQETLSRLLQDLSGKGLLLVQGRLIHIPDVNKLRAQAVAEARR